MKNFIIFFFIVMVISFLTPNLFIHDVIAIEKISLTELDSSGVLENLKEKLDLEDAEDVEVVEKIKLLLTDTSQIVEMNFDDYIKGVLIGEMPVSYELEALKAQALVARTYTLYKLKNAESIHNGADMCDDINCCQCFRTKEYAFASWDDSGEQAKWLKIEEAVNATKNQCIIYNDEIIAAFFHANSGGKTEDVKYIWGEVEIPYLKSVAGFEKDLDEEIITLTKDQFENLMKTKYDSYVYNSGDIKVIDYTTSGRVNSLQIGEITLKATELRNLLSLKSTNINIETTDETVIIKTNGYGHGVGMSQVGANQMALDGKKYDEIIKHYYTGVEIQSIS